MTTSLFTTSAYDAYEALAPDYDDFTAGYAHDSWLESIHGRASKLGIPGSRTLDLACGTGKSTAPLIARGYDVIACDISPRMIEIARRRMPELAEAFFVADMRALPQLDEVDWVLCLDDAINYLLSPEDLLATFTGVARTLTGGGLFVFDVNTLRTFRSTFAQTMVRETPQRFFAWNGHGDPQMAAGDVASADVEVFVAGAPGEWNRHTSRHTERHHPRDEVEAALSAAGLECCAIYGQARGGRLLDDADEDQHIKFVYFARRPGERRA